MLFRSKMNEAPELTTTSEFDLIAKKFRTSDEAGKIQILKKLKELASPSSTSLIEPDVKSNTRGQSSAKKKKLDRSTTREPSAFEYAVGMIERVPVKLSSAALTKKGED